MLAFAEPLALLFTGLYGVLVLFYLWERWRRRVEVPSLLLWEGVQEDVLRARRFRPDPLFVLQLLLLTCLIAGLARPYLSGLAATPIGGRHILLLDTSASMRARETQRTRFEEARAQALDMVKALPKDAEIMLVTTAPSPEVVLNFTADHAAVVQALQHAAPTDTGGDVSLALAFAQGAMQRSDVPTAVELFTDLPRSQLAVSVRDVASIFQVGETDANLAIEALQIFQGRFQDHRQARAYVLVENFGQREGHGFLSVQLEDQVVSRSGFTLAPRGSKSFVVQGFPGPGRVVARLETNDALAADNVALGWIRPLEPVRVVVVSEPSSLLADLREVAAAVPALQLSFLDPETFHLDQAQHGDVLVFHRYVPASAAPANALYIYPPATNSLFPVIGNAQDSEILDWDAHHPALQSLQPLGALPLRHARVVTPPAWSNVLLWSRDSQREFPLALAGKIDGHRIACLTFDLASEHLLSVENLNLFLLFTNILGWLSPSGQEPIVTKTGEVASLGELPNGALRVEDPLGAVVSLPPGQPMLLPLHAGAYRISTDGKQRFLLANFFDAAESDIGRPYKEPPPPRRVLTSSSKQPDGVPPRREYSAWLYYAAAALFLLEWAAYWRRRE